MAKRQPEDRQQIDLLATIPASLEGLDEIRRGTPAIMAQHTQRETMGTIEDTSPALYSAFREVDAFLEATPSTTTPLRHIAEKIALVSVAKTCDLNDLITYIEHGKAGELMAAKIVAEFQEDESTLKPLEYPKEEYVLQKVKSLFDILVQYSQSTNPGDHLSNAITNHFRGILGRQSVSDIFKCSLEGLNIQLDSLSPAAQEFFAASNHDQAQSLTEIIETTIKLRLKNEVKKFIKSEDFVASMKQSICKTIIEQATDLSTGKIDVDKLDRILAAKKLMFGEASHLLIPELTGHINYTVLGHNKQISPEQKTELLPLYHAILEHFNGQQSGYFASSDSTFDPNKEIAPQYINKVVAIAEITRLIEDNDITDDQLPGEKYYNWLAVFTNQPNLVYSDKSIQRRTKIREKLDGEFSLSFSMARSVLIDTKGSFTTTADHPHIPEVLNASSLYELLNVWNIREEIKEKYDISEARILMEIIRMKNLVVRARMVLKDPQVVNADRYKKAIDNHISTYIIPPEKGQKHTYITYEVKIPESVGSPEITSITYNNERPTDQPYILVQFATLKAPANREETTTNNYTETQVLIYSGSTQEYTCRKDPYSTLLKLIRYNRLSLDEKGFDQVRTTIVYLKDEEKNTVISQTSSIVTQDGTSQVRNGSSTDSSVNGFEATFIKAVVNGALEILEKDTGIGSSLKQIQQHVRFEVQIVSLRNLIRSIDPRFKTASIHFKLEQLRTVAEKSYPFLFYPELYATTNNLGSYERSFVG